MRLLSPRFLAFCLALGATLDASAFEIYGGAGTTGVELGVGQSLSDNIGLRFEANALSLSREFSTNDIHYDAKLKFSNVGLFADGFLAGSFRLTAGALVGDRKMHGTARSMGNSIVLNGVSYPVAAGDSLDFDAKFPTVSPYLGLGWGHHQAASGGWQFHADAGVAYGRPEVTLSPSASLAAKVSASDLAAEQASAQDQANHYRFYPVVKLGVGYAF